MTELSVQAVNGSLDALQAELRLMVDQGDLSACQAQHLLELAVHAVVVNRVAVEQDVAGALGALQREYLVSADDVPALTADLVSGYV